MTEELFERLAGIEGARVGPGAFGPGPGLYVGRREVAHVDADGAVDVRLTRSVIRARRAEFRADRRVTLRPSSSSDWLEVRVSSPADVAFVVGLVRDAVAANQ